MENNIRIPIKVLNDDQVINFKLEQDFDNLEVLSLKITSSDVYSKKSADFGVVVGRVVLNNGFGVQNAKVNIFVPIKPEDKERADIFELYSFETATDTLPNGVRYNLLPRRRNKRNPSHRAVGNFPDATDLTNYPQYLEVFETYYKYTTITNEAGDYMIFGVPLGAQNIVMDFDLFDTKSFEITANDLVSQNTLNEAVFNLENQINPTEDITDIDKYRVPGFIYKGRNNYEVELKTNLDEMPNIFHEVKQINVSPFWGDKDLFDIGITRCDFVINYKFQPTAVFFGFLSSMTNSFVIQDDYQFSAKKKPEIFARDENLGYDTGDIFPLQEFEVVIYKLDDKNNEGTRERVGVYKGYKGTGFFRLTLPMYKDYFTTNEYGDLIPSEDINVGIPTQGNYAFEIYETNDSFRGTKNVWGGYENAVIPGIRIPSSSTGDKWLGGWDGTWEGKFQYDLFNKKRKFYTIATTYRKHDTTSILMDGNEISYFPQISQFKASHYWNFPIDYRDAKYMNDVTVIGSTLIPRVQLKTNKTSTISTYPSSLITVPYIPASESFEKKIEDWEWFLGVGTQLEGLNSGPSYDALFSGSDFMVQSNPVPIKVVAKFPDGTTVYSNGMIKLPNGNLKHPDGTIEPNGVVPTMTTNTKKSIYGEVETFNWGDNSKKYPFNPTLYALELAQKPESNANPFSVHKPYTQAISKINTSGIFVNASDYQVGKVKFFEVGLYDITDELQELIVNKVYSSYKKTNSPDGTPGDGVYHLQNAYKGKYYYFGYWKGMNSLYDIETNYFNVIT